ncbi:hypothetical protein L9F63_009550, partial [Diploptera punctata]
RPIGRNKTTNISQGFLEPVGTSIAPMRLLFDGLVDCTLYLPSDWSASTVRYICLLIGQRRLLLFDGLVD